jgi:uncharacterized protein YcgI (DUF1989 family)
MAGNDLIRVPARKGKAQRLAHGQSIKVINTHGSQVLDTWAFNRDDLDEYMSMEHTRATMDKMMPETGEAFLTNRRRTPGVHDTLNAACDVYRYRLLGHDGYHDNCTDNMAAALAELGLASSRTPCPFNMFMNRPWGEGKRLYKEPPLTKPGDYMTLRSEMDCVVVFSACPQDMNVTNGADGIPKDVHYQVL